MFKILLAAAGLAIALTACTNNSSKPKETEAQQTKVVDGLEKTTITRKDDLPRHTYQLKVPASRLYEPQQREDLLVLANALRNDIEEDLERFDIQDNNTLQDRYATLGSVALIERRWHDYLGYLELRRELEAKEANRLTTGLIGEGIVRAQLSGVSDKRSEMARWLRTRLNELPWAQVSDSIKSTKGSSEILSRALVLGSIESSIQPVLEKSGGKMSFDIASRLVGTSFTMDWYLDNVDVVREILSDVIQANKRGKSDIWEDRKITLATDAAAEPVTIAVWDSGVDVDLFANPDQLWRNQDEIADNGIDDDKNGFVDDVNGIAWSLKSDKVTQILYPIGAFPRDEIVMRREQKGLSDNGFAVDSEEASELRQKMSTLQQSDVKDFLESLNMYGNYSHGTHVAGIALEGNPFARLLTARITFGYSVIPDEPSVEQARKDAIALRESIDYFKANGVRAVNMSWGGSLRGFESALEANNAGGTTDQRKALAREIYSITETVFKQAIVDAPEILFITSAGNSDNDVKFDEYYPSSYDMNNVLTVGAVDQEGKETSFTSLGKVDLYANGFNVESFVPGGVRIAYNGTSMSSPQVLNLTSKLLALNPDLSTAELRQFLIEGADEVNLGDRKIRLMNPKASLTLMQGGTL
jgi:subtilisin family serine protease